MIETYGQAGTGLALKDVCLDIISDDVDKETSR
jgi:hypothetical protein